MFKNLEWEGTFRKPMKAQRHKGVKWGSHGLKELMLPASQRRLLQGREQGMREERRLTFKRKNPFFPLPDTSCA